MPKDDRESDSDSDSDWNEELINAVRKKAGKSETIVEEERIKRVQVCLNEGADVDAVDKHNNTALHLAVKKGYIKVIRFLLKHGAKTDIRNQNGHTAVNLAEATDKEGLLKAVKEPVDLGTQTASASRDGVSLAIDQISVEDPGQIRLKRKNAVDNNQEDQNTKRRRIDTEAELDGEQMSFVEDYQSEDEEMICQQSSLFDGDDKLHAASGLKQTLHGNIYQLKLLMLFLNRGLRKGYAFRLATEMDAAEKFDDLVFQYENKNVNETVYRFLQAKHKQDENKTIGPHDLLTEKDDEFSLQKYFISYRKIMKHAELSKSAIKDFILCTNIDFDFDGLAAANILLTELSEPDDFLDNKTSSKKPARYKFVNDERSDNELNRILRRTAEAYGLAKILVEHACESKDITLRNDIVKLYHTALADEVIDVGKRQFSDKFITGKNLSSKGLNFREIFYREARKHKEFSKNKPSEDVLWEEMKNKHLKISSNFGQQFKLTTDPKLIPLKQFSEELVKLIRNADINNLVKINRKIYRRNAREGSNEKVFAENIDNLAGHVLIIENEKIKFRPQFFDDNIKLPGNLEDLKNLLKAQLGSILYNDLGKYQFEISNYKTCEEDQLYSKTGLPEDNVDNKEIAEFFSKLIFAVNQPNEIELEDIITREIAAGSQFNLLNADLIGASFQKEMLDWFKEKGKEKGKEGRFFSAEDGRAFFNSAEQKVNTLVSSGLSLAYPEELEEYGIEFKDENEELRDFLIQNPGGGVSPALNLIAADETLPTMIRVHQAIRRTGSFKEHDSLMLLRLGTLRLPGIRKRVMRAFESRYSHHLLVIDCESVGKQALQGLYNRLCETMRRNVGKKLILVTRENEVSAKRSKVRLKNCYESYDDISFNDLTTESCHKLMGKLIINFQGQRTSFNRLLGIRSFADVATQKVTNFGDHIDPRTLVELLRGIEIKIGNDLQELGEIEKYYINRTINREVVIKDDILRSKLKSADLFAISGINSGALTSLIGDEGRVRSFDDIDTLQQNMNEYIILDTDREEEQFKKLCVSSIANVHWLKTEWGKLIWKKSRDNIAALIAHRDVSEDRSSINSEIVKATLESSTEDQLIDYDNGQNIVIISDSAGMGKTTVLTYLAKKMKKPDLWVIRIDLNDFTDVLQGELKSQSFVVGDTNGVVEFLVEKLSNLKKNLEKSVLKTMIKSRDGVALLFDGFDEISPDYKNTVIDLLLGLKKIGVARLFIATRPHMREPLEDKLGIFSYTMEPFSIKDQIDFLVRFWKTGLGLHDVEERIKERLHTYAEALTNKMVKSIDDSMNEFAGIPLQTRMTAEIFQDNREGRVGKENLEVCEEFLHSENDEPNLPCRMRIVDLYESFVEKKYYVYCTEKKKEKPTNLGVQKDSTYLREIFFKRHQKLALHTLFNSEGFLNFLGPPLLPVLLDQQEIKSINENMTEIIEGNERTGIITQVVNGKSQFIHRTFAEYFAATFFIDILKHVDHNEMLKEFIVKQIMVEWKYKIIRKFLNGLLLELPLNQYLYNASATESWSKLLHEPHGTFDRSTVIQRAAREGNYEIVKFFLNRFEKQNETRRNLINAKDGSGDTIVHMVASQQHWNDLIWLVENEGADVILSTDDGRTPLHAAAFWGNLPMMKWLVDNGAVAGALTRDGKTPLYEAVRSGNLPVLEWLLNETQADVNCRNKYGRTVLHEAATIGRLDVVKWLVIVKNANVNASINDGKTVLHEAADKGQWHVVKWLITERKAHIDSKGSRNSTVLQTAASIGDLELVKWLVDNGADVNSTSLDHDTVLHVAASNRRWAVFRWLVENGADINAQSWTGETVLNKIAAQRKWEMVKWLVGERGANVNSKGSYGSTVLCEAAGRRQWDLVEWLLENSDADVNATSHGGGTVLCHAAAQNKWDTVRWLLEEKNADVNAKSEDAKTVLHFAASEHRWDLINWLVLDRGTDANIQAKDGMTLAHYAASSGQLDLMKSLVEKTRIDVTLKTRDGMTVLHHAAISGIIPLVEYLVEEKGFDINVKSYKGETTLQVAASFRQWDLVKWLLQKTGVNVENEDYDGHTVLHSAARCHQWDLLKLLATPDHVNVNAEARDGHTVLRFAVEAGDLDIIRWLIEVKGIDVNAKFRNKKTILNYAVASGHFQVVKWLVDDKGANVKTADTNNKTLLHEAAAAGKCEIFKWLVDNHALNIKAEDTDDRTVLHDAAAAGHIDMIRLLVEVYKIDVIATDDRGNTALGLYCENHRLRDEAIIRLLEQGNCNLQSVLRKRRCPPTWREAQSRGRRTVRTTRRNPLWKRKRMEQMRLSDF